MDNIEIIRCFNLEGSLLKTSLLKYDGSEVYLQEDVKSLGSYPNDQKLASWVRQKLVEIADADLDQEIEKGYKFAFSLISLDKLCSTPVKVDALCHAFSLPADKVTTMQEILKVETPRYIQAAKQNFEASVFLTACDCLSQPVYQVLNVLPITQAEIDETLQRIGSGDKSMDLGLFQVHLFGNFRKSGLAQQTDMPVQQDRAQAYILKKVQEMLCDFSMVVAKGANYQQNKEKREFVKKCLEMKKMQFEFLLQEFKSGHREIITTNVIEYFGLKLAFLADYAEHEPLNYERKHQYYYNTLDPYYTHNRKNKTEAFIESLNNELENRTGQITSDDINTFLQMSNTFIKDSWHSTAGIEENLFAQRVPLYAKNGITGIHAIIYGIFNQSFPIAITSSPHPLHAGVFDQLRLSTIEHDYQHFSDVINRKKGDTQNWGKKEISSFTPAIFASLARVYQKSIAQTDGIVKMKDMILLFALLHEKPKIVSCTFYTYWKAFFENNLRSILLSPYFPAQLFRSNPHIMHKMIRHAVFESIGYVKLLEKIGISINFDEASFQIPTDLPDREYEAQFQMHSTRIFQFHDQMAIELAHLWKDFATRYASDLSSMQNLSPGMFDFAQQDAQIEAAQKSL